MEFWAWNGLVQTVGYLTLGLSWVNRAIDEYVVNLGFDRGCEGMAQGGGLFSRLQTGRAQNYLRVIGLALAVLVLLKPRSICQRKVPSRLYAWRY